MSVDYEKLIFDNNVMFKDLSVGLSTVRDFIKSKKLILVGGQAIDYALRLKKDALYSLYAVPDYDFYSPDHYQDAIELGNTLCKKDLPNISIIYALHLTTIRVRINFVTVADITYCPKVIYNKLPVVNYQGIRVIHPHVQMIDQHRALSYAFENPNLGGSIFRWQKDIDRYAMLIKQYPLKEGSKKAEHTITVPISLLEGNCISGHAAQSIYNRTDKVTGKDYTFKVYNKELLILTDSYDNTIAEFQKKLKIKDVTHYNAFMGRISRHAILKYDYPIIIVDNLGSYISAWKIPIGEIYVSCTNYCLMYFLHTEDYWSYKQLMTLVQNGDDPNAGLIISHYGSENTPSAYKLFLETFEDQSMKSQVPKNLYPTEGVCDSVGSFDYSSPYFAIDGESIS